MYTSTEVRFTLLTYSLAQIIMYTSTEVRFTLLTYILAQILLNTSTEVCFCPIFQNFETAVNFLRSLILNMTNFSDDDVVLSG